MSFSNPEALVQKGDETAFGGIITDMTFSCRFWEKSDWESKTQYQKVFFTSRLLKGCIFFS